MGQPNRLFLLRCMKEPFAVISRFDTYSVVDLTSTSLGIEALSCGLAPSVLGPVLDHTHGADLRLKRCNQCAVGCSERLASVTRESAR